MKDSILKRYFNNTLSEEQELVLEKALMQNAFKQKYQNMIVEKGLSKPDADKPIETLVVSYMSWRRFGSLAAASIAVLAVIAWFLMNKPIQKRDSLTALVDLELQDKFPSPVTRLSTDTTPENWAAAKQDYQAHKFDEAAQKLTAIDPKRLNDTAIFYLGLSRLYQKSPNYVAAAQHLSAIVNKKENLYPESLWFLALTYLKNGDKQQGKLILEKLLTTKSLYKRQQAQLILEKL